MTPDPIPATPAAPVLTPKAGHTRSGWIQTHTGKQFWPLAPRVEDIDIYDIAHALSLKCRFTGHCRTFYSIAQHSILVSRNVPRRDALWGLLHDATEAYLPDVASPVKAAFCVESDGRLWHFDEIEQQLMRAIGKKFGLSPEMPPSVREADLAMLATEARDLMAKPPASWNHRAPAFKWEIEPWSPQQAVAWFMTQFGEVKGTVQR